METQVCKIEKGEELATAEVIVHLHGIAFRLHVCNKCNERLPMILVQNEITAIRVGRTFDPEISTEMFPSRRIGGEK